MTRLLLFVVICVFFASCRESLEERAARETKARTETYCPLKKDEFTTLDSMTFDKVSHTFNYYYTLSSTADRQFSDQEKATYRQGILKELIDNTKETIYKEAEYSYHYIYRSHSRKDTILYEVILTSEDY